MPQTHVVDPLDALAQQHGAISSAPTDPLDALAAQHGAIPPDPSMLSRAVTTAKDVALGAMKGAGNTVFGLGKAVHDYTPIGRISDAIQPGAFAHRPPELVPQNTAQRVGFTGEQVGEFLLPTGELGALGKVINAPRVLQAAKSVGLTLAQGGSPVEAGISGAIAAALPGTAALRTGVADSLASSAEKSVAQSLGATKEWAKSEAADLAPQILKRGIGGSRAAMLAEAERRTADVGKQIGAAVADAAKQGQTVSGDAFANAVAKARSGLTLTDSATGELSTIPGHEATVKTLDRLIAFVRTLGPDVPVEKAQAVKQAWDGIVSKAGLYGPKATSSATDNAQAWAIREGAGAMRTLISQGNPDLAALNQEFKFWKGLENVLTATEARTQAQSGGLTKAITGAAGAAAGFASGDSLTDKFEKAVFGGMVGKQLVAVVQSPAFRTQVSAPMKMALADALTSGSQGKVSYALTRIMASIPSQFRPVTSQ